MVYHKILFFLLLNILLLQPALNAQIKIEITNGNSLARLGKDQSLRPIYGDNQIALTLYNALSNKDRDSIEYAENFYLNLSQNDSTARSKIYSSLYWLSKCITANKKDLASDLEDPIAEDLYYYFTDNNFAKLREYLSIKYSLDPNNAKNIVNRDKGRFYNDLLLYNGPDREEWGKTTEIMNWLPLKSRDKVIDLGCGLGYYSLKLSKIVGEEGKVFATDINSRYIDHLNKIISRTEIKNIFPLITTPYDIGIHDSVDAVFICNLYHDLYLLSGDDERSALFNSLKQALKINGYLMIADNLNANGKEFNKRFIDRRLLIAQLAYWGFSYVDYKEFSNQRYVILFKNTNEPIKEQTLYADEKPHEGSFLINVDSKKSIIHYSDPEFNSVSKKGSEAARLAYDFFETGNPESAVKAIDLYKKIIPYENYGGEYGAVQWLCEVRNSPYNERIAILKKDALSNSFYNTMIREKNSLIKCFLIKKYKLNKELLGFSDSLSKIHCAVNKEFLEEYVLAMNPKREDWEKSSLIVNNMNLKKGQIIADVKCGPGYFTYRFSQLVGNEGRVYAVDFNDDIITALNNFVVEQNINNIEVIKGDYNSFSIKEKADVIFMCSFYHTLYGAYSEPDRQNFMKSITDNLKANGKLIIVDNGIAEGEVIQRNEPFFNKKLVEYQLAFYGFELISDVQITPQRYMFTFKLK